MIKNLFAIPILETKYENFQDIKQDVVDSISKLQFTDHSYLNNSVTNALQYGDELLLNRRHELPGIDKVITFIEDNLETYWKDTLKNVGKPKIIHLWANQYFDNGFNFAHHHVPTLVAGCFYINARPEMGNLRIQNPNEVILTAMTKDPQARSPGFFDYELEIEDGKLAIFPSWIWHRTMPNKTNETRIIIAFMVDVDRD